MLPNPHKSSEISSKQSLAMSHLIRWWENWKETRVNVPSSSLMLMMLDLDLISIWRVAGGEGGVWRDTARDCPHYRGTNEDVREAEYPAFLQLWRAIVRAKTDTQLTAEEELGKAWNFDQFYAGLHHGQSRFLILILIDFLYEIVVFKPNTSGFIC